MNIYPISQFQSNPYKYNKQPNFGSYYVTSKYAISNLNENALDFLENVVRKDFLNSKYCDIRIVQNPHSKTTPEPNVEIKIKNAFVNIINQETKKFKKQFELDWTRIDGVCRYASVISVTNYPNNIMTTTEYNFSDADYTVKKFEEKLAQLPMLKGPRYNWENYVALREGLALAYTLEAGYAARDKRMKKLDAPDEFAENAFQTSKITPFLELDKTEEFTEEVLRKKYGIAGEISKQIDEKYLSEIDCSDFDKALETAEEIMTEILTDETLNNKQKEAATLGIMVHMITTANLHQHVRGSTSKDIILKLAREKGLSDIEINEIEAAYAKNYKGYDELDDFRKAYSSISQVIRTPEDYKAAINSIVRESMKRGQLICEIRCSCDNLLDNETERVLNIKEGTDAIIRSIDEVKQEILKDGLNPPKISFVILTSRDKNHGNARETALMQAKEIVRLAQERPDMRFGFDIAGSEESGWGPRAFKESIDVIKQYNEDVKAGQKVGNAIGITMHAGETPTYEGGEGYKSVLEAIELGVNRIGHGIQMAKYLEMTQRTNPAEFERVIKLIKDNNITFEICGVCNVQSIPVNSRGMVQHAIQIFLKYGIPVVICTDNDAICGTNISKECLQFMLTGHNNLMRWDVIKEIARHSVEAAFISERDKAEVRKELERRLTLVPQCYENAFLKAKQIENDKTNERLNYLLNRN